MPPPHPKDTTYFITNTDPASSGTSSAYSGGGWSSSSPSPKHLNHSKKAAATTHVSTFNANSHFAAMRPYPFSDIAAMTSDEDGASIISTSPVPTSSIMSQEDEIHVISGADDLGGDDMSVEIAFDEEEYIPARAEAPEEGEGAEESEGPQFIMPRVTVPSRRPFTANGLKLGKLKVLVAGGAGVGKTSLIKAIACVNRDIVHIDEAIDATRDNSVKELHASTKPLPVFWMKDLDAASNNADEEQAPPQQQENMTRRPSLIHSASTVRSDETALDRNVCFVDTVGAVGPAETDAVIDYLEKQFKRTANLINMANPQALSILTSSASPDLPHADVCLYLITGHLKQDEVDFVARLTAFLPVIPVIAKCDLLSPTEIVKLKVDVLKQLDRAGVRPFLFDTRVADAIEAGERMLRTGALDEPATARLGEEEEEQQFLHPLLFPCAVACVENPETEMLASVLMSPDYAPGFVQSELMKLCNYVFNEHGAAWLRYTAAKKFLNWTVAAQVSNSLNFQLGAATTSTAPQPPPNLPSFNPSFIDDEEAGYSLIKFQCELEDEMEQQFTINLPNSMFGRRAKAQQQTAKWAMQLEQCARLENEQALRISLSSKRRIGNRLSTRRRPHGARSPGVSSSVRNLDPLGLHNLSTKAFTYAVRALSVFFGIKLVTLIYTLTKSSSSTCLPPGPPMTASAPAPKVSPRETVHSLRGLMNTVVESLMVGWR
ncbi:hypothetical protein TRVA0_074S00166 [Trichomonascus vanleenenianus]|uniref:uncharacterized protein n=1 Tax=Trichomonascus vanleenenianus TaxID=2268995 RepID=UPI003ECB216F